MRAGGIEMSGFGATVRKPQHGSPLVQPAASVTLAQYAPGAETCGVVQLPSSATFWHVAMMSPFGFRQTTVYGAVPPCGRETNVVDEPWQIVRLGSSTLH